MKKCLWIGVLAIFALPVVGQEKVEKVVSKKDVAKKVVLASAPDFTLKGIDGKTYKLSDYKDKIVVIEWVDQNCPWCKLHYNSGEMQKLAADLAKKGAVWMAIDSNHRHKSADVKTWADDQKVTYPILMDGDGKVGKSYKAKTTPHMFVLKDGKIRYQGALDNFDRRTKKATINYVSDAVTALVAGKDPKVTTTKPYG